MPKISFKDDYSEGAHIRILQKLLKTNLEQQTGYGEDLYCTEAAQLIRQKINNPDADIHFVSGGTQANLIILSCILKPFESVIAATTGHIAVHEAGAIENTGHKINTVTTENGKLTPEKIQPILYFHTDEHMVKPRVVYISNTTEIGTVYTKKELTYLSEFCRRNQLLLYMDGARLGSALTCITNDITLAELSSLMDLFYIGGTKNGALLGETIVINNPRLKDNFRFHMKQKGALLAKGRVLGIQFLELFRDDLFFELGKHSNQMAQILIEGIKKKGFSFMIEPASNQIFPILPNRIIKQLEEKYDFYIWQKTDKKHSAIRLVTSWATNEKSVEMFINNLH